MARGTHADVYVTATWEIVNYSITYVLNDNAQFPADNSSNPTTYTYEDAVTLAQPTRTGYTFAGWTPSDTIALHSTGDKTFRATWTPIAYTISYEFDGGYDDNANPRSYTAETATFSLTAPTKTGYTFIGWTGTDVTGTQTEVTVPQGSIGNRAFTAHWEANVYTVTYDGNGNTDGLAPYSITATYDVTFTVDENSFDKEGYHFNGWNTKADGTGRHIAENAEVSNLIDQGEITLYAQWALDTMYVTFINWDGEVLDVVGVEWGTSAEALAPVDLAVKNVEGYVYEFIGWDRDVSCVTQDMVTAAKFKCTVAAHPEDTKNYRVFFFDHDGTKLFETFVAEGDTAVYPYALPTREGYTFNSWNRTLTNVTESFSTYALYTGNDDIVVKFVNYDDTILEAYEIPLGTPALYSNFNYPLKPDADNHAFMFDGWDVPLTNDSDTLVIKATFKPIHQYTVLQHDETSHWFKCAYCDAIDENSLSEHIAGTVTVFDEVHPTCITGGSYKEIATCAFCGETIPSSETQHDVPATGIHAFGDWEVVTPATRETKGLEKRECANCDAFEEREIDYLSATRKITIVNVPDVTYIYFDSDGSEYVFNYARPFTCDADIDLTFKVQVNGNYKNLFVYANGTLLTPDANGVYTVPAGEEDLTFNVDYTPITNEGVDDSGSTDPANGGKTSFWQLIVNFFRTIANFFKKLFNK